MADSIRIQDDGSSVVNGITVNTPYDNKNMSVSVEDFLQLMIAEMTNQDFLSEGGGSDSTVYVTQLAQITTMQQMQELAYYSKTNYATSLVGKEVTVATMGLGASVKKDVGIVERVALEGDSYTVYVNGKGYELSEIMNVRDPSTVTDEGLSKLSKSQVILTQKSDTKAGVRWDIPETEEEGLADKISYRVYYSEKAPFDTVDDIEKGQLAGTVAAGEDPNLIIKDLEPGTHYYVNVIAVTPDGSKYPYKRVNFTTNEE